MKHTHTNKSHTHWPTALLILLAGFALRIHHLNHQPLSADEAFSLVVWTRSTLNHLFTTIALIDPQPPATLLTLYGWVRLVGDTEFAARMLSALASTITLATAYGAATLVFNHRIALISLALCAINPYQLWYAQDIRSYSLWMCTSALSLWLLLAALKNPTATSRWIPYVIVTALSIHTFYLEVFLIAAQNIFILPQLRKTPTLIKPWLYSQAAIALLLIPWFSRPSLWNSGYLPTAGPANIPKSIETFLFGETLPTAVQTPLFSIATHTFSITSLIATAIFLAALIATLNMKNTRDLPLIALYAVTPIAGLALLATLTHKGYFRARYASAASMPTLLLTSALLYALLTKSSNKRTNITAAIMLAILTLTPATLSTWQYYTSYSKAPPWREIIQTLTIQAKPTDLVLRNYPDPAFDYYYNLQVNTALLPTEATTPPEETHHTLSDLLSRYDHIWFMPVPSEAFDSQQVVFHWLDENAQLISEQWIANTHLMQYARWNVNPHQIEHQTTITFPNTATLRGYRITPPGTPQPGTTTFLELFWEPTTQTDRPMTIFTHLLGPPNLDGSPLWSQDDHPPQEGRITTQTWQPGSLIRDVYQLDIPESLPSGSYTVTVGFYDSNATRLTLSPDTPQAEPDGATLFTFQR